jgi:hypothetical protein
VEDDELFDEEQLEDYREEETQQVEVTLSLLNRDESPSLQDTPPTPPPPQNSLPNVAANNRQQGGETLGLSPPPPEGDASSDYNFFRPARNPGFFKYGQFNLRSEELKALISSHHIKMALFMDHICKKTPDPKFRLFLKLTRVKVLGGRCLPV